MRYARQARKFLAQAYDELERDDLHQASEKGWGATSQIVKAVADMRDVDHKGHGQLIAIARTLSAEQQDPEIRHHFNAGAELHTNFYEGYYDRGEVEDRLGKVSSFVDRLEGLLNGRNGASSASG